MIKNSLFLFFLIVTTTSVFAQETKDSASFASEKGELLPVTQELDRSFYPNSGDFGITANVSGLVANIIASPRTDLINQSSFLFRYTYSRNVTFRFGVAPLISRYRLLSTDSVGKDLVEFDSTASRSSVSFKPGVEFHLRGTRRLDPYVALDAELGLVGKLNIGSVSNITDTTGTSRVVRTITEDGGYALGGKLSVGMNYYLSQKFFLGLEYGMGVNSVIGGGDRQEVIQVEPVSGTNTTTRDLSSARTTDFKFLVDPMVQITVGYFFGF